MLRDWRGLPISMGGPLWLLRLQHRGTGGLRELLFTTEGTEGTENYVGEGLALQDGAEVGRDFFYFNYNYNHNGNCGTTPAPRSRGPHR